MNTAKSVPSAKESGNPPTTDNNDGDARKLTTKEQAARAEEEKLMRKAKRKAEQDTVNKWSSAPGKKIKEARDNNDDRKKLSDFIGLTIPLRLLPIATKGENKIVPTNENF